jgi:hypothetical protein
MAAALMADNRQQSEEMSSQPYVATRPKGSACEVSAAARLVLAFPDPSPRPSPRQSPAPPPPRFADTELGTWGT